MLPKSYLKAIAAYMVYESELSKYAKIQVLRFIEEASERQLHVLLREGKIRTVSDDEELAEFNPVKFFPPVMVFNGAVAAGKAVYEKFFGEAVKRCSEKPRGEERRRCLRDFKLKAHYAKLAALKREMGKCVKTNDVKKCRKMFTKHMQKIEKQIQKDRIL